jgi:HTH-type transcriptional regulator/antitoxin HigA
MTIKRNSMATLQYKVIKTDAQYNKYCVTLEALISSNKNKSLQDEIELITVLIERYDADHSSFKTIDPIQLLKGLMKDHHMKSVDLSTLLHVSEGLISDILKYKKGLSKESIRTLASHFKLNQEAFNRPYKLNTAKKSSPKKSSGSSLRRKSPARSTV